MISCENHVGRLIEVRLISPFEPSDLGALESRAIPARVKEKRVVCSDLRRAAILPAEAADSMQQMLVQELPNIERTALLLPPASPLLFMQINRFVRASGAAVRRTFLAEKELTEWLSEVLTPPERARLRAFLTANG